MWLSFFSNIVVFATALVLFYTLARGLRNRYFLYFVHLTGVSSLFAAFGHLNLLDVSLQECLLLISRLFSLASIFSFVTGTMKCFDYQSFKWLSRSNVVIIVSFTVWLIMDNIFLPVMYYGILGMAVVGLWAYGKNFKYHRRANGTIILGILVLVCSAVIFALFNNNAIIKPSDISHILIALSLVLMTRGFKQLDVHEITVKN